MLAGGLLLSHHAYVYDALLLLPALLLPFYAPWPDPWREWLRKWAVFIATPTAYLCLLTNVSIIFVILGHIAISGYALVLIIAVTVWRHPSDGTFNRTRNRQSLEGHHSVEPAGLSRSSASSIDG